MCSQGVPPSETIEFLLTCSRSTGEPVVDQIPNLGRELEMLEELGMSTMDDLFAIIPEDVRRKDSLPLPPPQSEEQILEDATRLLGANVHLDSIPKGLRRKSLPKWPRASEPELVRHYTGLSQKNFGIDTGFYPLGSCTMKHNPRVNERIVQMPGMDRIHPLQEDSQVQGLLSIYFEMQEMLAICSGMDAVTLQPVAGAQGEFTAIRCIQEYHKSNGEGHRDKVIVPDSAHGTNPASASMCGYQIVEIPSASDGRLDIQALEAAVGPDTAAMMITNPSTLGLFETNISEASRIVHEAGGQMYYDGANFNAIIGKTDPGRMGFDAVHYNLHKTFSQPHGGGGPGSGPIGVRDHLSRFLPTPMASRRESVEGDPDGVGDGYWYFWDDVGESSIGKVQQSLGILQEVRMRTGEDERVRSPEFQLPEAQDHESRIRCGRKDTLHAFRRR